MMRLRDDHDLVNFIERCSKCAFCLEDHRSHLPICPSTEYFHLASYRPPGRLELARALIGKYNDIGVKLTNMNEVLKRFYSCTLCGACDTKCRELTGKSPLRVFMGVRRELVNQEVAPPLSHRVLLQNVLYHGNPQGMPSEKRHERILKVINNSSLLTKEAPLLYFTGCTPSYSNNLPSHMTNMVEILKRTNTKFRILQDEPCCSHVLIKTGQEKLITDYMKKSLEKVKATGVKQILFTCPACYRAFKHEYPRLLGTKPDFECITASEFISSLLDEGKVQLSEKGGVGETTVTYHDPCHLGRQSGIYDQPRHILGSIKGLKLIEMPRNRENAWCCGIGGGVKTAFPEFSERTSEERIDEAVSIGASVLATACPACESGLKDALKTRNGKNNLEILDIVDVVAQSLS